MMRVICSGFVTLGLVFAASASAQAPDLATLDLVLRSVPDGPVARVREASIPPADFIGLYKEQVALASRSKKTIPDADRIQIALRCLGMLIENEILFQEAQKRKLSVTEQELQEGWRREVSFMQQRLGQGKPKPPTEAEILQHAGATKEQALKELGRSLVIEKARQAIINEKGVKVTDEDVARYYAEMKDKVKRPAQLHLKQIYLKALRTNDPEPKRQLARKKAEDALKRIRSGQSFESVAKNVSEGLGKEQGGDLGMMVVQDLPPFLVEKTHHMKPGDVSDVIESDYGFHVIQLVESVAAQDVSLAEAKPRLKQQLILEKGSKAVREFCKTVADTPDAVQVFLDIDKQAALHPGLLEELGAR
ncbi:MAG: peptidylprolyl isomerase [Candidatus Hydrogenedentes bacterium]|nr:peptidylprolyl isomerase [Candidatus Hydrogenedentota bacterium]